MSVIGILNSFGEIKVMRVNNESTVFFAIYEKIRIN